MAPPAEETATSIYAHESRGQKRTLHGGKRYIEPEASSDCRRFFQVLGVKCDRIGSGGNGQLREVLARASYRKRLLFEPFVKLRLLLIKYLEYVTHVFLRASP
jgi:hypothetical protein